MMTARFCLVKMTAGLFKSPGGHFFRFYCCQSQSNSQKQMHSGRDRIKNKIKKKAPPSLERANGGARSVSTPPGTWADKRCQRHT